MPVAAHIQQVHCGRQRSRRHERKLEMSSGLSRPEGSQSSQQLSLAREEQLIELLVDLFHVPD